MEPTLSIHTPLEVTLTHQRHHSQDSGAFLDWSSEDSNSPTNGSEEFVTVVSVENKQIPSPFVTVLEIGDDRSGEVVEEIRVYRLPGERLGFGLKFEGGTNTAEKVQRLFIQSSAPDSPASRAKCSWGTLVEGDEILEIDGTRVRDMTRLDCVRCLKESNVCIKLVIRHPAVVEHVLSINGTTPTVIAEVKKTPPPPPIPPRKTPRRGSAPEETEHIYSPVPKARSVQTEHKALTRVPSKELPEGPKVVRRNSLKNIPPEAEVYLDLLSTEDEIRSNWGSESDDTASTISTVVSMTNGFSDLPTDSVSSDFLFSKLSSGRDADSVSYDERSLYGDELQPTIFQDGQDEQVADELFTSSLRNFPEETLVEVDLTPVIQAPDDVKLSPPNVKKTSLIPRLAKSMGFMSPPKPSPRKEVPETKSKTKKRPPPPPPPPRAEKSPADEVPKRTIPYLKKKKLKEDDKKTSKFEKKAKKGRVSEREEALVTYFEPPSPEEEDEVQLSWPVPERVFITAGPDSSVDEVLPDVREIGEFGVEAVTATGAPGEPFFLFPWGSSKQLETIGEDEDEDEEIETEQVDPILDEGWDGVDKSIQATPHTPETITSPAGFEPSSSPPLSQLNSPTKNLPEPSQPFETPPESAVSVLPPQKVRVVSPEASPAAGEAKRVDSEPISLCREPSPCSEPIPVVVSGTNAGDAVTSDSLEEKLRSDCGEGAVTVADEMDPALNCPGMHHQKDNNASSDDTKGNDRHLHNFATSVESTSTLLAHGDMTTEMEVVSSLPPPSFNRLPPDGHEFPQKYREEMPSAEGKMLPPLPASEPPRRFQVLSKTKAKDWRQDERSGKSVRDKIAMFQSVPDAPVSPSGYAKLSKYKSSDDVFYDEEDRPLSRPFSRSIVSVDKVGARKNSFSSTGDSGSELGARTQSSLDLTSCYSSSAYSSSCSPDSSLSSTTSSYLGYATTLPRKALTTDSIKSESRPKAVTRTSSFNVHMRSQSLLDINPVVKRPKEDEKQMLTTLVEQRRRTMSKLRGLVIPDKSTETEVPKEPIFDLPEIKSREMPIKTTPSYERRTSCPVSKPSVPAASLASPPWKMPSQSPAIPKYSPAFKRKNISVYSSSTDFGKLSSTCNAPNKPPRSNGYAPRYSLDSVKPIKPDSTTDRVEIFKSNLRPNDFPKGLDYYGKKSDRSRSEEDSDNDSAVSSSRSSISPPASPLLGSHHGLSTLDLEKTPLVRTLSSETTASGTSNASTLTSGSHVSYGSDSDSQSKRVLKAQSVEAINRKNVLSSAKYSRGFDGKNGSPLIKRKLFEESLGEKITDSLEASEAYPRKYSNDSTNDIVCYKLADEFKNSNHVPEVKIAFLNHVEYEEVDALKRKVEKTESSPVEVTSIRPYAVPRRVSAPLSNSSWGSDWNEHSPLSSKISTESTRSRASSADTVVEKLSAEVIPSRIRTVESEGNFLDEADSCAEDNETFARPVATPWRKSSDHKLDSLDDASELEKRNKVVADRMAARNKRSVSVNDIRKAFEKAESQKAVESPKTNGVNGSVHARMSSLDSTTSDDSTVPYDSNLQREQFGSITSLASSTSLISPQELQSLIDEASLTLEEATGVSGTSLAGSHDVLVVILHRDSVGGSVGITLAGGADYEAKEITVHKVLAGSPADRDGRVQKGDRILSINGKSMKGVTHRESLSILKQPRPEVVLVVSRLKTEGNDSATSGTTDDVLTTSLRASLNGGTTRPPRILEGALLNENVVIAEDGPARGPPAYVQLLKDGAGLGFSLEGGKDSPLGDRPLVIKKIFTGGAAEKSGLLKAGDEVVNVNGVDVSQMSRIEAWKLMKRIPDGNVAIIVRRLL